MRTETNERDDGIELKGFEEDDMNREIGPQLEVKKSDRQRDGWPYQLKHLLKGLWM